MTAPWRKKKARRLTVRFGLPPVRRMSGPGVSGFHVSRGSEAAGHPTISLQNMQDACGEMRARSAGSGAGDALIFDDGCVRNSV